MKHFMATAAILGALAASSALAQTSDQAAPAASAPAAPAAAPKLSSQDMSFVHDAAIGGQAEVQLGQLAEQNAHTPSVKAFGRRMVADHTKINGQLAAAAKGEGAALPTEPDPRTQAEVERLGKMSGAAFDRDYIHSAVDAHQTTVTLFTNESRSGEDPALKQLATETLPTLQHHLEMAQNLDRQLNRRAPEAANARAPAQANGSSAPPRHREASDNSADQLNAQELQQLQSSH